MTLRRLVPAHVLALPVLFTVLLCGCKTMQGDAQARSRPVTSVPVRVMITWNESDGSSQVDEGGTVLVMVLLEESAHAGGQLVDIDYNGDEDLIEIPPSQQIQGRVGKELIPPGGNCVYFKLKTKQVGQDEHITITGQSQGAGGGTPKSCTLTIKNT